MVRRFALAAVVVVGSTACGPTTIDDKSALPAPAFTGVPTAALHARGAELRLPLAPSRAIPNGLLDDVMAVPKHAPVQPPPLAPTLPRASAAPADPPDVDESPEKPGVSL